MTELTRSELTSQRLVARLDALTTVAAQLPHGAAERLVELASIATMHAVALETLQAERAEEVWQEAHAHRAQHTPVVLELPERIAA